MRCRVRLYAIWWCGQSHGPWILKTDLLAPFAGPPDPMVASFIHPQRVHFSCVCSTWPLSAIVCVLDAWFSADGSQLWHATVDGCSLSFSLLFYLSLNWPVFVYVRMYVCDACLSMLPFGVTAHSAEQVCEGRGVAVLRSASIGSQTKNVPARFCFFWLWVTFFLSL